MLIWCLKSSNEWLDYNLWKYVRRVTRKINGRMRINFARFTIVTDVSLESNDFITHAVKVIDLYIKVKHV